ncbi:hypothetical protein B0H13DRAFT_1910410 [Mycena leptocephala]|nr:hypothetical protein B0H13DRAFT_1910410 [Mycena leptocephala]
MHGSSAPSLWTSPEFVAFLFRVDVCKVGRDLLSNGRCLEMAEQMIFGTFSVQHYYDRSLCLYGLEDMEEGTDYEPGGLFPVKLGNILAPEGSAQALHGIG